MTLEERVAVLEAEVQRLRSLVEGISISQVEGAVGVTINASGPVTLSCDEVEGDYGVTVNSSNSSTIQIISDSVEGDMSCAITAACEHVTVNMNAEQVEGDCAVLVDAPVTNLVTNSSQDSQLRTSDD